MNRSAFDTISTPSSRHTPERATVCGSWNASLKV